MPRKAVTADTDTDQLQDVVKTGLATAITTPGDVLYTAVVSLAGGGATDPEVVRDTIGAALAAGSARITITVNDAGDTITLDVPAASTTVAGAAELSTNAETQGLASGSVVVTPASLGATSTTTATASRLALRDASGRTQFADPSAAADAATKGWVEAGVGLAAVNTVAASGATETISGAFALHKVTMDQACTFTFTSPTAGAVFALLLSGAFTPTFPATVDWPDGTPPTYSTPALYVFSTFDGGTTWYGVQAGKAFA